MGLFNKKDERQRKQFSHEMEMQKVGLLQNQQLALDEYQRNRQSWNEQNEYNTPEKQMQRFRAAGLNPNLAYEMGTHGNASEMPKYSSPTVDYSNVANPSLNADQVHGRIMDYSQLMMDGLSQYMDVKTKAANLDQMKNYSNPRIEAETLNKDWGTNQKMIDYYQKKNLYGYKDDNDPYKPEKGDLTNYNQQIVDKRQQEIELIRKQNIKHYLENRLKEKGLDKFDRNEIREWIRALQPFSN